jgi:hypothetical protein
MTRAAAVWMTVSQPPRTPTPNWKGERAEEDAFIEAKQQHFEVMRRRVSPTAIGRTPPSFFCKAYKGALERAFIEAGGTFPATSRLIKVVSFKSTSAEAPPNEHVAMRSLK